MYVKTAPDSRFQRRYVFGRGKSHCRKELLASALLACLTLTGQYCCMSFCMTLQASSRSVICSWSVQALWGNPCHMRHLPQPKLLDLDMSTSTRRLRGNCWLSFFEIRAVSSPNDIGHLTTDAEATDTSSMLSPPGLSCLCKARAVKLSEDLASEIMQSDYTLRAVKALHQTMSEFQMEHPAQHCDGYDGQKNYKGGLLHLFSPHHQVHELLDPNTNIRLNYQSVQFIQPISKCTPKPQLSSWAPWPPSAPPAQLLPLPKHTACSTLVTAPPPTPPPPGSSTSLSPSPRPKQSPTCMSARTPTLEADARILRAPSRAAVRLFFFLSRSASFDMCTIFKG